MEITQDVRTQILTYAQQLTGSKEGAVTLHKFANRSGYMLTVETRNVEGFLQLLKWLEVNEFKDITAIRTLPKEYSIYSEFEQKSLAFFEYAHADFKIATEVSHGKIINMIKEEKQTHAI
ncbi:hypothetical protein P9B03_08475 [Metasolibacillus meyeri]|uniref:Uncharacterized protein n=1 Tax=Metasolibacillus meyeri TaxID=1071052 RepID=A0AAW9NRF6_9BACL|nr:hypothetical protein [Metasolibacillus meyeri]MEC1178513.1 hypothetical protein [Metasolibacillus meyeri]